MPMSVELCIPALWLGAHSPAIRILLSKRDTRLAGGAAEGAAEHVAEVALAAEAEAEGEVGELDVPVFQVLQRNGQAQVQTVLVG